MIYKKKKKDWSGDNAIEATKGLAKFQLGKAGMGPSRTFGPLCPFCPHGPDSPPFMCFVYYVEVIILIFAALVIITCEEKREREKGERSQETLATPSSHLGPAPVVRDP